MSLRSNIILALLLGVVATFIFKVELPREEHARESEQWFPNTTKQNLTRVEVKSGGREFSLVNSKPTPVIHERSAEVVDDALGEWQFENAVWSEIDQGNVSSLLNAILALKKESEIPESERDADLSRYGLSPSEVSLSVTVGDAKKSLLLGKFNAYVSKRYIKEESSPSIFLTTESVAGLVQKSVAEFRNKQIVKFDDDDVKEVSLVSKAGTLRIAPGEKSWQILEPIKVTASKTEVSTLFTALREVRAVGFPEKAVNPSDKEDPMVADLEKADLTVTINFVERTGRAPLVVKLKKIKGDFYKEEKNKKVYGPDRLVFTRNDSPARFVTADNPLSRLVRTPESMRETLLYRVDTVLTDKVEFGGKSVSPLTLEKTGEDWMLGEKKADSTFVAQLISDLSLVKAEAFAVPGKKMGFETPRLTVLTSLTRMGSDGKKVESMKLTVGAETSYSERNVESGKVNNAKLKGYFASVDDGKEPFIISEQTLKKITPKVETLLPVVSEKSEGVESDK